MAKKATEEVSKISKRQEKEAIKAARKTEKEANSKMRKDFEEKIDKKNEELKELKKNKASKSDIKATKKEISSLKKDRSNVGKIKKESFAGDVIEELKLVRWPSKLEVVKYSIATLVFVGFFALFFTLIDVVFALIKGWLS